MRQEQLEVRGLRGGSPVATTSTTMAMSSPVRPSCTALLTRSPIQASAIASTKKAAPTRAAPPARRAGERREVLAAEHRDDGGAEADAEEEPVPRHPRRRGAERRRTKVATPPASGCRAARCGEGARERDGEARKRCRPRRWRPDLRRRRRAPGKGEDARAEHRRRDVQGGCRRQPDAALALGTASRFCTAPVWRRGDRHARAASCQSRGRQERQERARSRR